MGVLVVKLSAFGDIIHSEMDPIFLDTY